MTSFKPLLVAGSVLGCSTVAWMVIMTVTGWYRDPLRLHLFWGMTLIQFIVLAVMLRRTRRGRSYGAQVGAGLIVNAVAAVIVFIGGLLVTGVVFPNYFSDLHEAQVQSLHAEGMSQEEVSEVLDKLAPSQTPGSRAFASFMGTLATGLLLSLLIATVAHDRQAGALKRRLR